MPGTPNVGRVTSLWWVACPLKVSWGSRSAAMTARRRSVAARRSRRAAPSVGRSGAPPPAAGRRPACPVPLPPGRSGRAPGVWAVSMLMGFIQSFTYAEIAGLFPNKSGSASVYGASAWVRYWKLIAPLSVWCNWLAWTPVLSLGCSIAAAYILNALGPIPGLELPEVAAWVKANASSLAADSPRIAEWLAANAGKTASDAAAALLAQDGVSALTPAFRTWSLAHGTIGPVSFSLNWTFFIGVALMLMTFAIQHRGMRHRKRPEIHRPHGHRADVDRGYRARSHRPDQLGQLLSVGPAQGGLRSGERSLGHRRLDAGLGGMFIAAWSTYAFETAICYTSELKNPKTDTFRAIFYSGLLCLVLYTLVPFTFQGVLGLNGMLEPSIVDGSGVAAAMRGDASFSGRKRRAQVHRTLEKVVDCFARAGWLSHRPERLDGQLCRAPSCRVEGWHCDHRGDGQFSGEPENE